MIICNINSDKKEVSIFKDNYLVEIKCFEELDYKKETNDDIKICNILKLVNKASIYIKTKHNAKEEDTKIVIDSKQVYNLLKPNDVLINKLSNAMKKSIKNNELKILLGSVLFEIHNIKNVEVELYIENDLEGDDNMMFGNSNITGSGMSLKNFKPMKLNSSESMDLDNKENDFSFDSNDDYQKESLTLEDTFLFDSKEDELSFDYEKEEDLSIEYPDDLKMQYNEDLNADYNLDEYSLKEDSTINENYSLVEDINTNEDIDNSLNLETTDFNNAFSLDTLGIGKSSKVIKKDSSETLSNMANQKEESIMSDGSAINMIEDAFNLKQENYMDELQKEYEINSKKMKDLNTLNEYELINNDVVEEVVETTIVENNNVIEDNNLIEEVTYEKNEPVQPLNILNTNKIDSNLETQLTKELENMERYISEQLESLNRQHKELEESSNLIINLSNLDMDDEDLVEQFNKGMEIRLRLKVIKKSCKIYANLKEQLQGDLSKF